MSELVHGVGLTDSKASKNGKVLKSYKLWKSMLTRCYYPKYHETRPTYKNCSVAGVWHKHSEFKKWYCLHYREGYQLDKDLLKPDNKIYSPNTCVYVPSQINSILLDSTATRGDYLKGVIIGKSGRFQARLTIKNKSLNLGCFDTPEQASTVYKQAKSIHIVDIASEYYQSSMIGLRVRDALIKYASELIK
jgi:hypothetical protein